MTHSILQHIDLANLLNHAIWTTIVFAATLFAMLIDLLTGIHKAKRNGEMRTSTGYKKTCNKAAKYFNPMLCTMAFDFVASAIVPFPVFTMIVGAFNIFCEVKSVREKYYEKAELRRQERTMRIFLENKDDIAHMMVQLLSEREENKGMLNNNHKQNPT